MNQGQIAITRDLIDNSYLEERELYRLEIKALTSQYYRWYARKEEGGIVYYKWAEVDPSMNYKRLLKEDGWYVTF